MVISRDITITLHLFTGEAINLASKDILYYSRNNSIDEIGQGSVVFANGHKYLVTESPGQIYLLVFSAR